MPRRVALVTDSTAALCPEDVARHAVTVVPLKVVVGKTPHVEGTPDLTRIVTDALRQGVPVTTSRPAPPDLLEVYMKAAAEGADSVVSIHMSAELSGTVEAARLAALQAPLPVAVVDSRLVGPGVGLSVLGAAVAADRGADGEAVADAARSRAAETSTLFYVDTLEHLRRGGRIGAAQALVGSALAVKPILHVSDGRIALLTKVRTAGRAIAELERRTVERAGTQEVEVVVLHLDSRFRATELASRLRAQIPRMARIVIQEAGPVIGAHAGPGMLAVVIAPAVRTPPR